ncbi:MarR family transcriptional regulator [Muricauda sp. 334s03]|uniref:MarR family transcriptional regulator n=1 Tax=Flagellimonas yonaguniensis TaxID=3031325 RepID=A0ABT5XWQ9_9FLAO|nr:MarR family transcriptional regulator [[Muricauda] yonaguniensis]MDF0715624.1 MarR family transcriptional regulator [[Muricauda] yonaguniensis]
MENKNDIIDTLISDWNRERPDLDATAMHIVGRLLILGKGLEKRANQSLGEFEIHYTDLDVLATLRRSGSPFELSPKELMQSVLITSGAMTALLDRLTKLGLIYRSPDAMDGRVKKAGLTEKGKDIIDRAIKIRFNEAKDSIACLTKKEKEAFLPLLKKLMGTLS